MRFKVDRVEKKKREDLKIKLNVSTITGLFKFMKEICKFMN